ncbi:hypothetical protein [Azospirillum sp. TSH100]|uniref:hypothetical protein n=1 Tax=Azospirillum sp. TSH100 TaxID=652764 RepID=UPI0010A99FBB|nr:hypothetical protein [Azospirillum sp. TSH100]QCG89042.1 hypothetical protein E6C72_14565 [Azospirillum sp. TSH100]
MSLGHLLKNGGIADVSINSGYQRRMPDERSCCIRKKSCHRAGCILPSFQALPHAIGTIGRLAHTTLRKLRAITTLPSPSIHSIDGN